MIRMHHAPRGQLLILASFFLAALVIFILALQTNLANTGHTATIIQRQRMARNLAEAGIDHARFLLNTNANYGGEILAYGGGEIEIAVTSIGQNLRQIESTGYLPTKAAPRAQRTVRVQITIDATNVAFNYGVQVDQGGLGMANNARINGNLYSNGSAVGGNGSRITGDVYIATGLTDDVSHQMQSAGADGEFQFGRANPVIDVAQSFKPTRDGPVSEVRLRLKKVGNTANRPVAIVGDTGDNPDDSEIFSTGTLIASQVSENTYDWISIPLSPVQDVEDGTIYWIVIDAEQQTSKYWYWAKDKNQGYGNGVGKSTQDWAAASPTWAAVDGDFNFRIAIGGAVTSIDNVDVTGSAHANTIKDLAVTGDAYYRSLINSTVGGTSHPDTDDPPLQPLPFSDANIADFETSAAAGGVTNCTGTLTISGTVTIGPQKYTCNVTFGNGSSITLAGPIWVTGNMNADLNAVIRLDPAYGNGSAVIVADNPADPTGSGIISIENNLQIFGSGSPGSYIMMLSTHSGATPAISIHNNTTGAIFYSSKGTIKVFNNVQLKEATGYRLELEENATVTYESGLANIIFTSGPGGSWQLIPHTWQEL